MAHDDFSEHEARAKKSDPARGKSHKALWAAGLVVVALLVALGLKMTGGGDNLRFDRATFLARKGPLTISVLESGTIKSREQVILKNEVEGQTSIISLIEEGKWVKKGDLLVELDASSLGDDLIDQEIRVQNAEAAFINARETLAVVENQAIADKDVAALTFDFAKQDLDQYKQGLFPNEKKAAENEITLREEELTRAEENLIWSQKLFDKKYISKNDLIADQLAVIRNKNDLELAQNNAKLLLDFTYLRQIAQLESDVRQADLALERTERKATADVVQAKADLTAKELEFKRQSDKLQKIEDQIEKARIHAPVDGMVIYATSARRGGWRDNREPLDVGVDVRERQELIYLPVASGSIAEVDIHEGSLEKVRVGLPAVITVEALQGRKFTGSVGRIAPLPDAQSMWMNPDLKVYNSDVYLEEDDQSLRTGMSCKVEIIVEEYDDVVFIPIQAVVRVGGKPTVYVVKEGALEERTVEIGLDNNRMVHVLEGLAEGELVLLTPPLKPAAVEPKSRSRKTDGSLPSGPESIPTEPGKRPEEARSGKDEEQKSTEV